MKNNVKRIIIAVAAAALLSGCAPGNGSDRGGSQSSNNVLNSNQKLNIINNGKEIVIGDENSFELLEQIEAIVEEECTYEAVLSRLLSDSEIDSYKSSGLFISVNYENAKAFPIGYELEPKSINGIRILISEKMPNYILYYPTAGISKVFGLPQKSYDAIMTFLND